MREIQTELPALATPLTWFQFDLFADLRDRLIHGVFARHGGVSHAPYDTLNAGSTVGDDPSDVAENRARVAATFPEIAALYTARPVHGHAVVPVARGDGALVDPHTSFIAAQGDAMVSQARGVGLFWAYADCTPIMMVDPAHDAIALVHAGWRGTSEAVAVMALQAMSGRFGTRPGDVHIGMGPSIGPCCYEVDAPVQEAFAANALARSSGHFSVVEVVDGAGGQRDSLRLDVAASNRAQLLAAGVDASQIEMSEYCTGCRRDLFFSHRMEKSRTGRFAVVIALR